MKKYILAVLLILIIIDRFFIMQYRVSGIWEYENGTFLGDPIAAHYDFELKGDRIRMKRNKSLDNVVINKEIKLMGCYFGYLWMYDVTSNTFITYLKR